MWPRAEPPPTPSTAPPAVPEGGPPPVPATAAPVASEPEPAGPLQDGSGLEYEEAAVTGPFSERLSCGRVPLWNAPFFIDAFADAYIPKHFGLNIASSYNLIQVVFMGGLLVLSP